MDDADSTGASGKGHATARSHDRAISWVLRQCMTGASSKLCSCRGGGEYGNTWWEHGHLLEKQNSFDDFASCAQYLRTSNWTSPAKLTIQVAC